MSPDGPVGPASAPAAAAPAPVDRPLVAAAWMSLALSCFSGMAIAGREAAAELDTFEILAYRSVIALAVVVAALGASGRLGQVRARRMRLHLARNAFHFAGQNCWLYAVAAIPLAQVFAYEFTSPIWIALLAPLVLGERFARIRLVSAAIGFAGILVIARPWAGGAEAAIGPGQLAALGAALGFAFNIMLTKRLSTTETAGSILFFMSLMQGVMGFAFAGWDGEMALPLTAWPWVATVALAGLGAHYAVARALACAPATIVAPMDFGRLPMIAVVAAILYGEPLELAVLLGGALVLSANLINLRAERRRAAA
ncbi:DMT family transporter [Albimonas sp. CAU 1670]|uniref:DMT family transporter n=1 Tax=Albimonas sp. CAU 1670 TaxID=3032599 RepID=UPI0023DA8091|nr:DMT family transporter [Albimonas sp. CAU 1670]MDF2232711.1 DMT family transporter [Albimonas sp. CAU 1670]